MKTSEGLVMCMFGSRKTMTALMVLALAGFGNAGCARGRSGLDEGRAGNDVGAIGLDLQVASGISLDRAQYTITGAGAFVKMGVINVAHSSTISAVISGIPAGTGYTITAEATVVGAPTTTCAGAGEFNVTAHATTALMVHLTCHEAPRTGTVAVNGTINVCPVLDGVSANPAEVVVGGSIALSAAAHDLDSTPAALAYHWTATSGTFNDAVSATPVFTCAAPGPVTITVTVNDGDATPGCADAAVVQATCRLPGAGGPVVPLTIAVYGDAPYGTTPTDVAEFLAAPAFIQSVNADPDVALVLQVGDIHSGKQFCTEPYDRSIFDLWSAFQAPLVYTPGDNEWTDCHKPAEGGGTYNATTGQIDFVVGPTGTPVDYAKGDPIANLELVRSIFFPTPGVSLGIKKRQLLSQAQVPDPAHPQDAAFVENVMWEQSKVLFVAINLPGGSNNDTDVWYGAPTATAAQVAETANRTGADLRWLDMAFAQAQADNVVAVVIQAQADMWDPEKGAAHQAAFEPYVQSLASHATAFGKPVLMFNGDSHVYLSHNPMSPTDTLAAMHPGYDVPNFHRIVVHGSTFPLEWLRLTIDPGANAPDGPDAFGPFAWTRVILP